MKNEMEIGSHTIKLSLPNPGDWMTALRITGKMKEVTPGVFEMALSTHNLNRIDRLFTGDRRPVVVSGRAHLDALKEKLRAYKESRDQVQEILALERYPVEPNGKFIPYAHQTKIIGVALVNPFSPICADCGLGKTGSSGRVIELVLQKGEVTPGKILVSAPLSILDTSWGDDLTKFTHLRWAKLWAPMSNKTLLDGERVLLQDLGPKPANTVAVRSKSGVWYKHPKSGVTKKKIDTLDGAGWDKYSARWKVATDLLGQEIIFGEVIGRKAETEKTRENFIKEQLARKDVDVFLINHDGVRIYESILKDHAFEWLFVDESTKIKSSKAAVAQAHVEISWKCKRRNILSGTPNPNGFEDLWYQYYFLDRGLTLEPALKDYLAEYFTPVPAGDMGGVKYFIKNADAKKRLVERVRSVGIFLEQRDCIDLPPRTDMKRAIMMIPEQEAAYKQMAEQLVATLQDEVTQNMVESEALNTLSKLLRLRQITSGFLSNREGELVSLTKNPKYDDLDDLLEELGDKKVVLVCQFREEIRALLERYKHLGATAIFGDVKPDERTENIRRFQTEDSNRIIILHPQATAHGITLTAASYMVFMSLSYNFEHYYQIAKRIERIGQKHPMFVLHSLARFSDGTETIDEILMDVMKDKAEDRNALFGKTKAELARSILDRIKKQVEAT